MSVSQSVIKSAKAELNERRQKAERELELRKIEIYAKFPEIARIEKSIVNTSIELTKAICSHEGNITEMIDKIKSDNLDNQRKIETMLKSMGYSEDYLKPHYTCPKCHDTGYVEGIRCGCLSRLITKYHIEEMSKGCKIKLHDFSEFVPEYYPNQPDSNGINPQAKMMAIKNYCQNYTDSFNSNSPSLFMLGKTGLGKTFLSSCIAKDLLVSGKSVAFDSIQNYLTQIENEHFGRSDGDTMKALDEADLVILDDLGNEFSTPFSQSALYNIINNRINLEKPIIISTNLSLSQLNERYDDRIISRLLSFEPLRFFGIDIRQIKIKLKNR